MSLPWSSKGVKVSPVNADELLILDSNDANPATQNKRITIGSMPPSEVFTWTADHDAVGFDLLNVGGITMNNPADTFQYIITPAAITTNRIANLPLLTTDDTFVFEAFAQPLVAKTINVDLNTFPQSVPAAGEYLRDDGTSFVPSVIINTDLPPGIDSQKIVLSNGQILVGNASNEATNVIMSGDSTIDNTGVLTISNNAITDAKTSTFTTTKITTLSKSLLNTEIVYNDQNNVLGAFYQDIEEITTPANPSAGTRRLFVDDSTNEISVRTSSGTTISLEVPPATITDLALGTLDAPNFQYIDTGRNWAGNDNGSSTLGINLPTAEPAGTNYTFTYTIDANDFPVGMQGFQFNDFSMHFAGQVVNSDAVSSNVSFKAFINDVELEPGGDSTSVSAGNFGSFFAYDTEVSVSVGDIFQIKLWTDGSVLVDLETFGVYVYPIEIQCSGKSVTCNYDGFQNTEFVADDPQNVTLTTKGTTIFPQYQILSNNSSFAAFYPDGNNRMILGENAFVDPDDRVDIFNTATNQMRLPTVEFINQYRVVE